GRQGPHRARGGHAGHAQAVPALRRGHRYQGLPGPRPLVDHRQRVARGRGPVAVLAEGAGPLMSDQSRSPAWRRVRTLSAVAVLAVAALAAPATLASANPARSPAPKPTIVLVHGAWAD